MKKPFYIYTFDHHRIFQTPNLWETYQNYNYIIAHDKHAVIFDPGELEPLQNTLLKNQLQLDAILLTHHHGDHSNAARSLQDIWKCPIYGYGPDQTRLPSLQHPLQDGQVLELLDLKFQILHCPGHTHGLVVFWEPHKKWLFCNDLIFPFGCGRVFEGTYEEMFHSLQRVFNINDPDTLLFSSHEYALSNLAFLTQEFPNQRDYQNLMKNFIEKYHAEIPSSPTRLGDEKKWNPFLNPNQPELKIICYGHDQVSDLDFFTHLRTRRNSFKSPY